MGLKSPQLAGSAFKGFSYVKPDLTTHTAAAWVQMIQEEAQHDQDFGFKKELMSKQILLFRSKTLPV
jgi:hypothetical protein